MLGAVPVPAALEVAESGRKSCFSARSIARFSVRRPRAFIEAAVVSGWASDFKSCTCGASENIKLMRELYASWSASEDPARCHTSTLLPHIMVALWPPMDASHSCQSACGSRIQAAASTLALTSHRCIGAAGHMSCTRYCHASIPGHLAISRIRFGQAP